MSEFIVGSNIRVIDPSLQLRAWCKKELVLTNPDYEKKLRMNKWVGNTPKTIQLYEQDGTDLIIPYGCFERVGLLEKIQSIEYEPLMQNHKLLDVESDPVVLYDYQSHAVDWMYLIGGGVLQSPAGSGKTQMGIALIQRYRTKTLWVTHTQDLLNQSYERAKQYIPEKYLGTITAGTVNIGEWITFATVQTLCNIDLNAHRYDWDLIICDECHRVAGSPTAVTMFYKVLNSLAAHHKYGLSATMHRSDGMIKACTALLGDVRWTVPDTAVAARVLKVKVRPINTEFSPTLSSMNFDGTLNYAKLINEMVEDPERNGLIAHYLLCNRKESVLVLSSRVSHLKELMSMLPEELREKAVMIDGKMTSKKARQERADAIEQMRTGEKTYLFATYQLAKEGLDVPRLNRLFMVTPQKDLAVIIQSIGRIARVHEDKTEAICYDFVDDSQYCVKAYRKRCAIYRKQGCEFV